MHQQPPHAPRSPKSASRSGHCFKVSGRNVSDSLLFVRVIIVGERTPHLQVVARHLAIKINRCASVEISCYNLPEIIRLRTLAVMRCTRGSSLLKSRRGGFISPGGVESTMFHQQVPASKTMLPFGNS